MCAPCDSLPVTLTFSAINLALSSVRARQGACADPDPLEARHDLLMELADQIFRPYGLTGATKLQELYVEGVLVLSQVSCEVGARQGVAKFLELTFSCIHTRI